ncbi:hypothetical protein NEMIN01_1859 [Nematocida minor]|uniref:uncharacterized protein n=1 Tax=Nematocida minor TaxID=1912983 RepID=UPI0022211B47|nr:uncharacterized protein NEMIN01_1859 [Nematocida minor]KAI5192166.1 hypothetical protein NEMIN01_1859 [Nematocida minor]
MQNQKLRAILNAGTVLVLFITECRGSGNAFNQKVPDRSAMYIDEDRVACKLGGLYFSSASFPMCISPMEKIRSLYLADSIAGRSVQPQQCTAESSAEESLLSQTDTGAEPPREKKKKNG